MQQYWRRVGLAMVAWACVALASCSGGMVKRVSPPAASIQQLTVHADGSWSVDLRLQNYSSMPMRFDTVTLAVTADEQQAGTLQATPHLSIGPESADIVNVAFQPSSLARLAVADALAGRRSLAYSLKGNIDATPDEKKSRSFDVDTRNLLNPAPGLDGVLR